MDKSEQIFFDRGPDSFMAEVIQIIAPSKIHIDIDKGEANRDRRVCIDVEGESAGGEFTFRSVQFGRSYGEALRKIRDDLRKQTRRP